MLRATFALLFLSSSLITQQHVDAQWYQQPFPADDYLWKVSFADENTGWIVGADSVYRTSDGGLSWSVQSTPAGPCYALHALDDTNALYAIFNDGIRRTSDGGLTWALVDSLPMYYTDFEFVTPEVGYAAGGTIPDYNSILRKTTDGGESWTTVSIIPQDNYGEFEGISFVSEMLGWGITYAGTIYKTTDGGLSWTISDSSGGVWSMRDIDFIDANMGWAVGGIAGTMQLWRTTDGGASWIKDEQMGSSLRDISMMSSEVGWIGGLINSPPWVGRTDDGGITWTAQDLIPPHNYGFESLTMVDENTGWAVTCCGLVYKTTNGGVTFVGNNDELPGSFSLSQNYPNPFNAQTTLRFEIGDVGYVRLELFDPLGRSVVTLVDEKLAPGSYTRSWDAGGIASGVYYYRLQADGYVETKKLVLIR